MWKKLAGIFCDEWTNERLVPWGWEGDGVLAWLVADDERVEIVVQVKLSAVDFSFHRPQLPFPGVVEGPRCCRHSLWLNNFWCAA